MFATTNWTAIAAATLSGDAAGRQALESLCRNYHPAVLGFLRSRGLTPEDAEDAVQEFFQQFLASRAWRRVDRTRGRFRTFLLGALMHVLDHLREHQQAQKRGGGAILLSLDELASDGVEPAMVEPDAELQFDREWAQALLANALAAIEAGYSDPREFAILRRFLPGAGEPPSYAEAATDLGLSEAGITSRIHRLRTQLREKLRAAVACTVSGPPEVEAELGHLRAVLLSEID